MAIGYSTNVGKVRLLIGDTDEANLTLSDPQVQAFLTLNEESVRLAAADALDAIASSEVMVSKVIRDRDLSTDGTRVSAELRARAKDLRSMGAEEDVFDLVGGEPDFALLEATEDGYVIDWRLWP